MLNDVLQSIGKERNEANNRCMKAIFEPTDPKTLEEPWYDFANNLAVDLDNYEPNPERRKESASYHDDESPAFQESGVQHYMHDLAVSETVLGAFGGEFRELNKASDLGYGDRYLEHLDKNLVNVDPAVVGLTGGLWPKSWALAVPPHWRIPSPGTGNPLTSVPRGLFGVRAAGSTVARGGVAAIGVATVGVGFYNWGIILGGFAYAW